MIAGYEFYGIEIPKGLIPPELNDIEVGLWRAFSDLSSERSSGMVAGAIPWSSMVMYHNHNSFGLDMTDFIEIISEMDSAFLSHKPEK